MSPGFSFKIEKLDVSICSRCQSSFECKVGAIHLCQCWEVSLNAEEREYIKEAYEKCLCAAYLLIEKRKYHQKPIDLKRKKINYNVY